MERCLPRGTRLAGLFPAQIAYKVDLRKVPEYSISRLAYTEAFVVGAVMAVEKQEAQLA